MRILQSVTIVAARPPQSLHCLMREVIVAINSSIFFAANAFLYCLTTFTMPEGADGLRSYLAICDAILFHLNEVEVW